MGLFHYNGEVYISFFAENMPKLPSRALFAIIIIQQVVIFIHEWDVSVHSTRSRTRSLSRSESDSKANRSVKGVFVQNIQQITCSVASHIEGYWLEDYLIFGRMKQSAEQTAVWVNGLRERERFVHLKDLFKKNDSFTNVTSLFFSKHLMYIQCTLQTYLLSFFIKIAQKI